jgi:phosphate transport system substrate-binding protein
MDRFGGRPFSPKYEALENRAAVLKALAGDSHGIALTGWVAGNKVAPSLRILPLSAQSDAQPYTPALADVSQGRYPLSSYLHLYVNARPGVPLEPFIKEYLRIALSEEGQALVRGQLNSEEGYVPLSPADLAAEREKLKKL